jgi:hypothetical protein
MAGDESCKSLADEAALQLKALQQGHVIRVERKGGVVATCQSRSSASVCCEAKAPDAVEVFKKQ